MKIENIFGFLNSFSLFPSTAATLSIAFACPTMVSLSPIWSTRLLDGRMSIPARFTLVTLIPNELRRCRSPIFAPFTFSLVTSTWRDTSCPSIEFQSMSFLFQSLSTIFPNRRSAIPTSFSLHSASTCSPSSSTVSPLGIITLPFGPSSCSLSVNFHTLDTTI